MLMTKKYSLPMIHNWDNAKKLSENERTRLLNEVCDYFNDNPDERVFYAATGDTAIIGINHDDELIIMDTIMRKEYTFFKDAP